MPPSYPALRRLALLLALLALSAAGCQTSRPPENHSVPAFQRTTTPTWKPDWKNLTSQPSATPLFRASRVIGHYRQSLILYTGDTFLLDNLQDSIAPVEYDPGLLQLLSDPAADFNAPKTFKALRPGVTQITTTVAAPCPLAPVGCQPPEHETLVSVTVTDPPQ